MRGGRKGGALVCEENGLRSKEAIIFTEVAGNTMIEKDVPAKLKHFNAHVAMVAQLSIAGSHGFA